MSEAHDKFDRLLDSSSRNLVNAFFDNFQKSNTSFRAKAGLKQVVIRKELGSCCDWCRSLAGTYTYGDEPQEVWMRHANCRCMVITRTEKGTYQDAWSRKEYENERAARVARERELMKENKISLRNIYEKQVENAKMIVDTKGKRNEIPLTKQQKKECKEYAVQLGMPEEKIVFVEDMYTAYFDLGDRLYISPDVYPNENSNSVNGRLSHRCALAHEIVGHRETFLRGTSQEPGSSLDEAQASIRAARFADGLTTKERFMLIKDGITRLRRDGISISDVKRQMDIHER